MIFVESFSHTFFNRLRAYSITPTTLANEQSRYIKFKYNVNHAKIELRDNNTFDTRFFRIPPTPARIPILLFFPE